MNQGTYRYPVSKPCLTDKDRRAVMQELMADQISSRGPRVKEFAHEFAVAHGAKFGVPCNSGTNAIYLGLKALGIGPGDEVLVPEFTMIATAYAVSYTGAKPVFVDCDKAGLMDPNHLIAAMTPRTRAIIPVHVYGRRVDMTRILQFANVNGLKVLEDSAEAIGIPMNSDGAAFSLFANKTITSGEGGIFITNDENLAKEAEHLANMAFDPEHTFLHSKIAHNYRMTNLQAALALSQLKRLPLLLKKRALIESWYEKHLPEQLKGYPRDVLWMYDVYFKDYEQRDRIKFTLDQLGIETRVVFKPMSIQKPYYNPWVFQTKAFDLSQRGFYLPTYVDLTEDDIKDISNAVGSCL